MFFLGVYEGVERKHTLCKANLGNCSSRIDPLMEHFYNSNSNIFIFQPVLIQTSIILEKKDLSHGTYTATYIDFLETYFVVKAANKKKQRKIKTARTIKFLPHYPLSLHQGDMIAAAWKMCTSKLRTSL